MSARATPLALLVALAACSGRPADIPAPAPGLLARFGDGCPDLRGTYALTRPDGTRRRFPGRALDAVDAGPRHHSRWTIESVDAARLVIRTAADTADMQRGLEAWRKDNAYGYALWSQSLTARPVPDGLRLERRGTAALDTPPALPRDSRFTLEGHAFRCEDGWLVFTGEPEPDADNAERAQVRVTRATDGGLVATWRFRRSRSFSLWCGDGCKPNIPLPDETVVRWWHASPAPPADEAAVDWQALVSSDPRPAAVRERYREGRVMRYREAATAAPVPETGAPKSTRDATLALGVRAAVAPVAAASPARDPGDEARWRERLGPLLVEGMRIVKVDCEASACRLQGDAATMADVSTLLRALDAQAGSTPELILIERLPAAAYRFELRLPSG